MEEDTEDFEIVYEKLSRMLVKPKRELVGDLDNEQAMMQQQSSSKRATEFLNVIIPSRCDWRTNAPIDSCSTSVVSDDDSISVTGINSAPTSPRAARIPDVEVHDLGLSDLSELDTPTPQRPDKECNDLECGEIDSDHTLCEDEMDVAGASIEDRLRSRDKHKRWNSKMSRQEHRHHHKNLKKEKAEKKKLTKDPICELRRLGDKNMEGSKKKKRDEKKRMAKLADKGVKVIIKQIEDLITIDNDVDSDPSTGGGLGLGQCVKNENVEIMDNGERNAFAQRGGPSYIFQKEPPPQDDTQSKYRASTSRSHREMPSTSSSNRNNRLDSVLKQVGRLLKEPLKTADRQGDKSAGSLKALLDIVEDLRQKNKNKDSPGHHPSTSVGNVYRGVRVRMPSVPTTLDISQLATAQRVLYLTKLKEVARNSVLCPLGVAYDPALERFLYTAPTTVMACSLNGEDCGSVLQGLNRPTAIVVVRPGELLAVLDDEAIRVVDIIRQQSHYVGKNYNRRFRGIAATSEGYIATLQIGNMPQVVLFNPAAENEVVCRLPLTVPSPFSQHGVQPCFMSCVNDMIFITDLGTQHIFCVEVVKEISPRPILKTLYSKYVGSPSMPKEQTFSFISGIVADVNHHILIADAKRQNLRCFSAVGAPLYRVQFEQGTQFPYCSTFAIAPCGKLLACDRHSNRMVLFKLGARVIEPDRNHMDEMLFAANV